MDETFYEFVQKHIENNKFDLYSSHTKICLPIVYRIYQKMIIGIRFSGIKVDKDLIIDGHHRYLASSLAGTELDRYNSVRTSSTYIVKWDHVEFDFDDWDTPAKILMLNELDAKFNNLSVQKLVSLLK
jgi:hypothetical protein